MRESEFLLEKNGKESQIKISVERRTPPRSGLVQPVIVYP
jgi:hypothetical protein